MCCSTGASARFTKKTIMPKEKFIYYTAIGWLPNRRNPKFICFIWTSGTLCNLISCLLASIDLEMNIICLCSSIKLLEANRAKVIYEHCKGKAYLPPQPD